jgi:hypothetical protein
MSHEERTFLSLPRYPACLDLQESCWILGLKLHEGRILVRKRKLLPSGKNQSRKAKKFATAYVLELVDDQDWLADARNTITSHWEIVNRRRQKKSEA